LHVMAEAEKRLFAVREKIGDPAFNPGVDERVQRMITKDFAGSLHAGIGEKATSAAEVLQLRDKGTSSISAIDEAGNAIVLTTTVNDAFGASGGSTIPTTVAQILVHMVDDHIAVDRAIAAPRLHHNLLPYVLHAEDDALEAATAHALEARGHKLQFGSDPLSPGAGHGFFDAPWGKACGVEIDPETGWRIADCDSR